jgi:hypothetical protein
MQQITTGLEEKECEEEVILKEVRRNRYRILGTKRNGDDLNERLWDL